MQPPNQPTTGVANSPVAVSVHLAGTTPSGPAAMPSRPSLVWWEIVVLGTALLAWLAVFLAGTLVNSSPFRTRFAAFDGTAGVVLVDGLIVAATYTLTNVGLLCILASALGALGARAGLGPDGDAAHAHDSTSPTSSAVLRGFFVYTAVLAGVLVFADQPVNPTQTQYVRLAGLTSLLAFLLNYHPALFGNLLKRAGELVGK